MGFVDGVKKIWNKTIFPEKIEAIKERKRKQREMEAEDAKWREELRVKARETAKVEAEAKILEQYKQQEINRMVRGPQKKGITMEKIAEGFKMGGNGSEKDKMNKKVLDGFGITGSEGISSDDKIKNMLGLGRDEEEEKPKKKKKTTKKKATKKKETKKKEETYEEKIKRLLE